MLTRRRFLGVGAAVVAIPSAITTARPVRQMGDVGISDLSGATIAELEATFGGTLII